ncbi:hypothetical protein HDV00_010312, partial [Rhizophlyctis rosea]
MDARGGDGGESGRSRGREGEYDAGSSVARTPPDNRDIHPKTPPPPSRRDHGDAPVGSRSDIAADIHSSSSSKPAARPTTPPLPPLPPPTSARRASNEPLRNTGGADTRRASADARIPAPAPPVEDDIPSAKFGSYGRYSKDYVPAKIDSVHEEEREAKRRKVDVRSKSPVVPGGVPALPSEFGVVRERGVGRVGGDRRWVVHGPEWGKEQEGDAVHLVKGGSGGVVMGSPVRRASKEGSLGGEGKLPAIKEVRSVYAVEGPGEVGFVPEVPPVPPLPSESESRSVELASRQSGGESLRSWLPSVTSERDRTSGEDMGGDERGVYGYGGVKSLREGSLDSALEDDVVGYFDGEGGYRHTPPPGTFTGSGSPARWATYGSGMWKPGVVGLGLGIAGGGGEGVKHCRGGSDETLILRSSEDSRGVGVGDGDDEEEEDDGEVTLRPQRRETLVLLQERRNGSGVKVENGGVMTPPEGLQHIPFPSSGLSLHPHTASTLPASHTNDNGHHQLHRTPRFLSPSANHLTSFHTTPADTDEEEGEEEEPYGPVIGRLERGWYLELLGRCEGMERELRELREEVRVLRGVVARGGGGVGEGGDGEEK